MTQARTRIFRWVIGTILCLGAGMAAAPAVVMLPMLFDAPGSERNALLIWIARAILVLPVFCVVGAGLPWLVRRWRFAGWLFWVPVIDVVVIAVLFWALGRLCGGSFACGAA